MLSASFITGTILIVCGFLVEWNPDLIAGYNTMSKTEKEKVDIGSLSTMMKKYLVAIGSLVILSGSIISLLKIKEYYGVLIMGTVVILGVIIMIITGQKYTKRN